MLRRFVFLLALVLSGAALAPRPAQAGNGVDLLKTSALPAALPLDVPTTPFRSCPKICEIEIEGTIAAGQPVTVVLRMDDAQSSGYGSRVNEEKTLLPGPFKWRKSLFGIRAVNGRAMYGREINRLIFFVARGDSAVKVTSFKLIEQPDLAAGAIGLSFGHVEAPLLSGFERVGSTDPRLTGQIFNIRHTTPDPLISGGMRGVQRVRQPWPRGFARVSLWTEDPGEWENLPHPLERRIVINGIEVFRSKQTPPQWVRQRYLQGSDEEAGSEPDPWLIFGQHRGGLVTAEVPVGDEGIVVEQEGDGPAGTYLAAMLVEPAGQRAALDAVLALRARWYRETWPVGPPRLHHAAYEVEIDTAQSEPARLTLDLAPGTGARGIISIASKALVAAPEIEIDAPTSEAGVLRVKVWAAQRQLDRADVSSNLLVVKDERLRTASRRFAIRPETPRRYEIWVDAPAAAKPGTYSGRLTFGDAAHRAAVALDIVVLPVTLPEVAKPAGFFHDEAPHLSWFSWPGDLRRRQIGCDIAVLASFGLTGNAPAFSTPMVNRSDDMLRDMQVALQNGNHLPFMAYSPAPRALAEQGADVSIQSIADADQRIVDKGLERLIWSVADEPSNPDLAGGDLKGWVRMLRAAVPGIKLAAHLNNKADKALLPLFDVAIVNGGYGLDVSDLSAIAAKNIEPWIYNADALRFTAGLWLWNTAAQHYVQWHARLPTADPFDPTDGREGDAQVFYPSMEICPTQPDMNVRLLEMAEGIVDQRWLQWLDGRPEDEAKALSKNIKAALGQAFAISAEFDDTRMARIRQSIITLSNRLN